MKKLILLGACLLTFTACPAQTVPAAEPDIVVVRIQENILKAQLAVIRGENKVEMLEFSTGYRLGASSTSNTEKGLAQSGLSYHKVFYKLYQEGYSLQSTFTSAGDFSVTTLLFVKAK